MSPTQQLLTDVTGDEILTPAGFDRVYRGTLEAKIRVYPARAWYPSSLGHPCDRFSVWRFTRSHEQARHSPVLQAIFDQGNEVQPLIYARLDAMGFKVIREHDRPIQYHPKAGITVSGRPDGKLLAWRGTKFTPARVLEAKGLSAWAYDSIDTIDDIKRHKSHYTRAYYAQGMLYAYLEDLPHGVFVLYSKATGMLKCIPFDLDYDYVEQLLQRVERLQPMIATRQDPPPIPYDPYICGGCAFLGLCYPPRSFGEGAQVLDDPDLVEKLQRHHDLTEGAAEYRSLHEVITEKLKRQGVQFAVAGPFVIDGRQSANGRTVFKIERLG